MRQYRFRKNNSTEKALIELCDKIVSSLLKKDHVLEVFMELSKVIDTLFHKIILYKLQCYDVRRITLQWFEIYLSNRKQFTTVHKENSDIYQ